jgi:hypothetical protein
MILVFLVSTVVAPSVLADLHEGKGKGKGYEKSMQKANEKAGEVRDRANDAREAAEERAEEASERGEMAVDESRAAAARKRCRDEGLSAEECRARIEENGGRSFGSDESRAATARKRCLDEGLSEEECRARIEERGEELSERGEMAVGGRGAEMRDRRDERKAIMQEAKGSSEPGTPQKGKKPWWRFWGSDEDSVPE